MIPRSNDPAPKRPRGRPKGTGINDAPVLAAVRLLMAGDRALRPTTAIKRAGVVDPSAVRRLREKLHTDATAERPRLAVAALAASRPETVSEMPVAARAASAPLPAAATPAHAPLSKHPPLAAETEKRTREALLLAAYLEAMIKAPPLTAEPSLDAPTPIDAAVSEGRMKSGGAIGAEAIDPRPVEAPPQPQAQQSRSTEPPPPPSFSFPGMPPFLQPFLQPQASQQLEGMKLAVEAMTSMTKLQLHITENAFAYSPMAMMLQGQAMVGQMLLASFTGQLDGMKPKKKDGTP
jgi:hypothetical protein